jgi:hypothetical protein
VLATFFNFFLFGLSRESYPFASSEVSYVGLLSNTLEGSLDAVVREDRAYGDVIYPSSA